MHHFDSLEDNARIKKNHKNLITTFIKDLIEELIIMLIQTPITFIFLSIMIIMFWIQLFRDAPSGFISLSFKPDTLFAAGGNFQYMIRTDGQYGRLIWSLFLSDGSLHFLINIVVLFKTMFKVQKKISYRLYIFLLLVGGLQGNMLANLIIKYKLKIIMAVGASIPICSVIGFTYAQFLFTYFNGKSQTTNRARYVLLTMGYIQLISLLPGVDYWGHLGGLVSGFLIGSSALEIQKQNLILKKTQTISRVSFIIYSIILLGIFDII